MNWAIVIPVILLRPRSYAKIRGWGRGHFVTALITVMTRLIEHVCARVLNASDGGLQRLWLRWLNRFACRCLLPSRRGVKGVICSYGCALILEVCHCDSVWWANFPAAIPRKCTINVEEDWDTVRSYASRQNLRGRCCAIPPVCAARDFFRFCVINAPRDVSKGLYCLSDLLFYFLLWKSFVNNKNKMKNTDWSAYINFNNIQNLNCVDILRKAQCWGSSLMNVLLKICFSILNFKLLLTNFLSKMSLGAFLLH